ncbi:membrane protein [RtMc arterivirus]|uniref:Membrane protein n=1 Tax=RtMc arterivirus TaxID=2847274 RepID=A0A2H4MXK5_9NIDO|nr:membrane protein [Rodent arterivirus]ATP66634.1 membrane protein [RtMc arterivirus]
MGTRLDQFCDKNSGVAAAILAFSITYTPILIYLLKVSRGRLYGALHVIIFFNCAYAFGYLVYSHFSSTNVVAITMGAMVLLMWGVYSAYKAVWFIIYRCRMCCLGRKYILAPSHHVESAAGPIPIVADDNHALVIRKPGSTTVNGTLVPGLQGLVLGGKKAVKQGVVTLLKYARK